MLLKLIAVNAYALDFILHCPITRKHTSLRRSLRGRNGLEYKIATEPFKNMRSSGIGTAWFPFGLLFAGNFRYAALNLNHFV